MPISKDELSALDALKRRGIQKGHWVAQAIREKLIKEGLIKEEP